VPTTNGEFLIGSLLWYPYEHLSAQVLDALHTAGFGDLRSAHMTVFQNLPPAGCRLTELAAAARMTKQSMGYLVDHLEKGGYLARHADPRDGRASLITRTERGWSVNKVAKDAVRRVQAKWERRLGRQRFGQLRESLAELAASLGVQYQESVSEVTSRRSD
jgi:DNA-binding MarR family transcriptional regulator